MKEFALCILVGLGIFSVQAQTPAPVTSAPPPGTISSTNALGMGNVTFTNSSGQSYTMPQLAGQLQNLRAAVEDSLPLLSAFNETFSNTLSGSQGTLASAIFGIFSGNRNSASQEQGNATNANSSRLGNLLGALQGILGNTNAPTTALNTNTVHDLVALENELQPVASILRSLNLQPAANTAISGSPGNRIGFPPPAAPPTPTGR